MRARPRACDVQSYPCKIPSPDEMLTILYAVITWSAATSFSAVSRSYTSCFSSRERRVIVFSNASMVLPVHLDEALDACLAVNQYVHMQTFGVSVYLRVTRRRVCVRMCTHLILSSDASIISSMAV